MPAILLSLRFGMAGLLLVLGGWSISAMVPNGRPSTLPKAANADIRKAGPSSRLPASLITVHKQPAIPHKPFPMLHPQTGQAIQAETMLTLPNGKQIKAGEYYAQLNQWEKKLNALGHTLRDAGKRVVLQENKVDKASLSAQAQKVAAKHRPFDARTMQKPPTFSTLLATHQAAQKATPRSKAPAPPAAGSAPRKGSDPKKGGTTAAHKNGGGAPATGATAPSTGPAAPSTGGAPGRTGTSDHELQSFNFPVGDNKTASAFLTGQLEATLSPQVVDLKGEAHAGVYLVNNKIEVLTATAAVHAGGGASSNAQLTVSVLGQNVYNLNQPIQTSWSKTDTVSKTVDYSVPFSFDLGPIPISAKVGARGSAGVSYIFTVNAVPPFASAQVIPNAGIDAYGQVGIDIKIADVGVSATLQLLHVSLTVGGQVGLLSDPRGQNLFLFVHGDDDLTMLNGSLSFYADVSLPSIDINQIKDPPGPGVKQVGGRGRPQPQVQAAFGFDKKHFEHSFFSWTGFQKKGTLFNVLRRTYLPAKAAPAPTPAPGTAPVNAPAKAPTKAPAKQPAKAPAKAPARTSPHAPTKQPAKTPTKVPVKPR
jgi:hypothetical protein